MAEQESALRDASKAGNVDEVAKLLAAGVKQTADENGETPLLLASSNYITEPKYVEVVRALIDAGAEINAKNKEGDAAIHNAASLGNLEIMELLLESGADMELEGESKMVALGLAATKKHHAVVNQLVQKLIEDKKFSNKQVEWMNKAANERQQLDIYRALTSIFQDKTALRELLKYGVANAITSGMSKFSKKSIQTAGLQLLQLVMSIEEGLASVKAANITDAVKKATAEHASDSVVDHLVKEVLGKL